MKRFFQLFLALILMLSMGIPVYSAQTDRPIVALGADLTAEERAVVLSEMGLTEGDLQNCTVIMITNEMEHRYLDPYLDPAVIGSRSLSSIMLTKADPGNGVLVTTKNINYCTTGMYRNALLTAGVEDVNVLVVGPSPISGTAALIGALLAYEEMTGTAVSGEALDAALNELIITGDIAMENVDNEQIEELFAFIKGKLAAGELDTPQEIAQAIIEGEKKFQVSLSLEQRQQILQVMEKIGELGLDPEKLLDQAKDMYEQWGTELLSNTQEAIKKTFMDSVKDFFSDMASTVTDFFKGLF